MESEIQKKIEKKGMIISRIPDWTKVEIYQEAQLHSDDYGEAIAQFVREAIEYRMLKERFFNGDIQVNISEPKQEVNDEEEKEVTMANGKKIKYKEVTK
jgi:hypothetical protein